MGQFTADLHAAFDPEPDTPLYRLIQEMGGVYEDHGKTTARDLQGAKARIGRLDRQERVGEPNGAPDAPPPVLAPSTHYLAGAEALARKLRPSVSELRRNLFGDASPPFKDEQEAKVWLAGALAVRVERSEEEEARLFEAEERLRSAAEAVEELGGADVEWTVRPTKVPAWHEEDGYVWITVRPGSVYWTFGRAVRELWRVLRLHPSDVIFHVLTGEPLEPLPVPVRKERWTPAFPGLRHTAFTLELVVPLTYRDMRQLHAQLRERWPEPDVEPLDPDLRELAEIVQEVRPDSAYHRAGWEAVAVEWQSRGREQANWRALAARYDYARKERAPSHPVLRAPWESKDEAHEAGHDPLDAQAWDRVAEAVLDDSSGGERSGRETGQ